MGEKKQVNRMLFVRSLLIALLMLLVLFGRRFAPHDPGMTVLSATLKPPSWEFPFGTDHLGRCILSRVLYGAPVSVLAGLAATAASTVIGTTAGILAGYRGGAADKIISQTVTTFQAFPSFLLAAAVAGVLGSGVQNGILALILVSWTGYARFAKGLVSRMKHENYLQAARLHGAKTPHIIGKYILPNIVSPVIVTGVQEVGSIILSISALSFLGLGAAPPLPEWGAMMSEARKSLQIAPWYLLFPGLALWITVSCFNGLGDALRRKAEI